MHPTITKILPWLCWSLFISALVMPVFSFTEANPITGKIVMLFSIQTEGISAATPVIFSGWKTALILCLQAPLYVGLTLKGLILLLINISVVSLATIPFAYGSNRYTRFISTSSCLFSVTCLTVLISQQPMGIQTNIGAYLWLFALVTLIVIRIINICTKVPTTDLASTGTQSS